MSGQDGHGRSRALGAVVAAVAIGVLTGCGSGHDVSSAAHTPAAHPLTLATAKRALHEYLSVDAIARHSGDERLALSLTGNGQSELTAAAYRKAVYSGSRLPRYRYLHPTLYVPHVADYPQWFVVSARRVSGPGGKRPDRRALLVLSRAKPDQPWRMSFSALLDRGTRPPALVHDGAGYVDALPTTQGGLVAMPRTVGALQATTAEEGPHGPAAAVLADGPHTGGLYRDAQHTEQTAQRHGLRYNAIVKATGDPIYALRTKAGGALVLYTVTRNAVTRPDHASKAHIRVPRSAAHLLDKSVAHHELDVTATSQYAAIDPPGGKDPRNPAQKIRITAATSAPTSAEADPHN